MARQHIMVKARVEQNYSPHDQGVKDGERKGSVPTIPLEGKSPVTRSLPTKFYLLMAPLPPARAITGDKDFNTWAFGGHSKLCQSEISNQNNIICSFQVKFTL
jgi:hypothetical protein